MKILKRFLFIGWTLFLLVLMGDKAILSSTNESRAELTDKGFSFEDAKFEEKELDTFLEGKEYVFKRQWRKARQRLELYLKRNPSGHVRDEALYWLAQCLNKISKDQVDKDMVIELKEEAVKKLDLLIQQYPGSVWLDDAQELRIEISGELALIGKTEYKKIIQHIYETQEKTETDLKLIALNSLIELEPEAAIPFLKKIIETDKDPQVRKKVILLLGKKYTHGVITLLEDVSKKDPDREVREEASYWLEQIKIRSIPVSLNYYVFSAQLTDASEFKQIPENKMNIFTFPRGKPGDEDRVKKEINALFNNKLLDLTRQSGGRADILVTIFDFSVSHKISGFRLQFLKEGFEKSYDHISGKVLYQDLDDNKNYYAPFTVDGENEKLLAMRNGDQVALMFLQFESELEPGHAEEEPGKEPMYSSEFSNVLGCRVLSARQNWDRGEYGADPLDFGQAKAEIPGKKGKWTLKGYIMLVKKERRFIARRAVLINPEGKAVARGNQIIVPVDNPSQYKVTGKKTN